MDINRKNMDNIFTAYSKAFKKAFESMPVEYQSYTMTMNVNQTRLEMPFLEKFAKMREWIGPRQVKNLSSKKIIYTEKSFEDTVGLPVRDVETDSFGLYSELISELGDAAANQRGINAFEALVTNDTWIDDKAFYVADRAYGESTINNYTTAAFSEAAFNAAYLLMSGYRDHKGNSLKSRPNVLRVGPSNRTAAWNVLKNQFAYDATAKVQIENVNKDVVDMVIDDELAGSYAAYWFLMNTKNRIKPVFQNVPYSPKLVRKDKIDDDNVFDEDKFKYGTTLRTATGKTFPHLVYLGNGTA